MKRINPRVVIWLLFIAVAAYVMIEALQRS